MIGVVDVNVVRIGREKWLPSLYSFRCIRLGDCDICKCELIFYCESFERYPLMYCLEIAPIAMHVCMPLLGASKLHVMTTIQSTPTWREGHMIHGQLDKISKPEERTTVI